MSEAPKDFEVTVRVRNNRIKERRVALGLSQGALAAASEVPRDAIMAYEGLRLDPMGRHGWKPSARKLAQFFCVPPSELWPEAVLAVKHPEATRVMNAVEVRALVAAAEVPSLPSPEETVINAEWAAKIGPMLDLISPMEARILRWRFGLDDEDELTLQEIGDKYNLSAQRIRQLEAQALAKLRRCMHEEVA